MKVRRVGYEGESRSRPRSSRVESVEGICDGCGATKMVFSTLATTRGMRERRTRGLKFFILRILLSSTLMYWWL
jgi:hypothetical protein